MAEGVKHTVETVVGDRLTSFHIKPAVELGRLVGLPRPKFFGSEGLEMIDFQGMWPKQGEASVVALESEIFRGSGATYSVESYETAVTDHLDSLAAIDAANPTE
jgi:hypothetical protein